MGSGDGSVGKAVASDTRGPQFESQHRKVFIEYCLLSTVNCIEKMKIKKKWTGVAHFLKNRSFAISYFSLQSVHFRMPMDNT